MKLNEYIDHTNLKQDATKKDIEKLCSEAKEHQFKSVCINPGYVTFAKELLKDSSVLVCTVIGFPLGANTPKIKGLETSDAICNGADEIDMVINVSAVKNKNYGLIQEEIKEVVKNASNKTVKVIIETCLLNDEEKKKLCHVVMDAKANFIKTSTGFSTGGATFDDIELFNSEIKGQIEIKASGGVRTKEDALAMIKLGATRLGTSGGVSIVSGIENLDNY